ncbi:hypothetical protein KDW55_03100 [Burkholderia sp. AU19243]|uniref:hypothetical protein n=1 Tax=Burkholderia TaxID=32008 RepID=UPI0012E3A44D|nr:MULTISPECIES: hypothetical protein [Burkholderia]MBR8145267.1 hypothetical protein [Burkholderia vietnamiensis]MBR8362306.1 hypothetical protein [Burkholderia sp. AU19243]MBY4695608.1 hypothetical protein [Burkholderia latens]MCA8307467.1 hypothetical protein [Burkholderia sp. AU28942]QTO44487.1 hypothetical protein J8I85_06200 [Burkholderia latens]
MVVRLVMAERHRNGTVKVLKAYRVCVKKKRAGEHELPSWRESHRFRFLGVRAARLRLKYFKPECDPARRTSGASRFAGRGRPPFFRSQDWMRDEQPET